MSVAFHVRDFHVRDDVGEIGWLEMGGGRQLKLKQNLVLNMIK